MKLLFAVHLDEGRVLQEANRQQRQCPAAVLRQMVLFRELMPRRQDENHFLGVELGKRERVGIDGLCRNDEVGIAREYGLLEALRCVLRELQADTRVLLLELGQERGEEVRAAERRAADDEVALRTAELILNVAVELRVEFHDALRRLEVPLPDCRWAQRLRTAVEERRADFLLDALQKLRERRLRDVELLRCT